MKPGQRWRVRYAKSSMKTEAWRFFATEDEARAFYTKVSRHPLLLWSSIGHMVEDTASSLQSILNSQILDAQGFWILWHRTPKKVRDRILKKQRDTLREMIEDLLP